MRIKNFLRLLLLLLIFGISQPIIAQVNPQNLNNIRVDELSDNQVRNFMRQAEASGMGDAQLEQMAQARGMRPEEVKKLRERVDKLKKDTPDPNKVQQKTEAGDREMNSKQDSTAVKKNPETEAEKSFNALSLKIFGEDLFKNSELSFEPNLSIATPKNYIVGPNDELLIDIYGNSEASYNLKVSPEGNINVEYVGMIPVSGLTIEAATSRIRSRLSSVYNGLRNGNTSLNIAVSNFRSIKVILTGEIVKPGTYTLSSLANVFNALYSSGGPTLNGSFRGIELIRAGKKIATLDMYDFLMKGDMSENTRLEDQDIIRVPVYQSRVEIVGEIKHPGIFELRSGESFKDLLNFAGDFTENAFRARVKVLKNTDIERKIVDINSDKFSEYKPNTGDKYFVDRVLERFVNRVSIEGAVFRPGFYELDQGLTLLQLVKKAEGLKEDAFLQRAYITRLRSDNQTELISVNLAGILNGSLKDIALLREDVINVSSIFDLKEEFKVIIDGEVREPGTFNYSEKMTLEELVLKAGGFTEAANFQRVEISRRIKTSDINSLAGITVQVFQVDIDKNLDFSKSGFVLQPYDIVSVRSSIGYEVQRQVKVEGEVLYPGMYTITNKDERISDLLKRTGGLTALAYPKGASLKREGPAKINDKNAIDEKEDVENKLAKLQRLQKNAYNTEITEVKNETLKNVYVGIQLDKILETPGAKSDLILEEGDILRVPKQLQTVKVNGEVLYPVTTVFNQGKGFKHYISQGGGFSNASLKRRSYVIYANGAVKSTSKLIFFNMYPAIEPGSELFIPQKQDKRPTSAAEIVGISGGLASLAVIILNLVR
jgi:protein involved in polysaccharide export with SLBB domain